MIVKISMIVLLLMFEIAVLAGGIIYYYVKQVKYTRACRNSLYK